MYLFFDTETTGLPDYKADPSDVKQPFIVQLAMVLTDETGREMRSFKAPIKTPGLLIDETGEAFKVNQIAQAHVEKYGIPADEALDLFEEYESLAELKIAYGYRFDGFLIKSMFARIGKAQREQKIDRYCAMKGYQDAYGGKFVKLADSYRTICGRELKDAHDSLADVRAAKTVFFYLKEKGLFIPQPRSEERAA